MVDLSGVNFVDSTGVSMLVAGWRQARERGGALGLVCDAEGVLRRLRQTGLDEVLVVYPTLNAALAE